MEHNNNSTTNNNNNNNDHSAVNIRVEDQQQQQPYPYAYSSSTNNNNNPSEIGVTSPSTTTNAQTQPRSASASASSPDTKPVNGLHYSILLNKEIPEDFATQIKDGEVFTLACDSDGSTLLHIAASVGQSHFIEALLKRCQDLLWTPNSKKDLPLHVAAKACQNDAVSKLVQWDYDNSLGTLDSVNYDSDTALHISLQNHQRKMAGSLFQVCSHTYCLLNSQGISPLYLAIKAEFWDLVKIMIETHQKSQEGCLGKEIAKSVIHAAITAKKQDIVELMLETFSMDLIAYKTDEKNRTVLSYAAYTGFHEVVKYMINSKNSEKFKNLAYLIDKNGHFPIHWACCGGHMRVVKEFFRGSPANTKLLLNNHGQSILHVAAASGKAEVVKYILQQKDLGTLINMKDMNGNTPLHLASLGKHPRVVYTLTWNHRVKLAILNNRGRTALDISEMDSVGIPSFQERLTWQSLIYAGAPRTAQLHSSSELNFMCPNITNSDPETFVNDYNASSTEEVNMSPTTVMEPNPSNHNYCKERINTLLIVSTLVTTVTYAAGFTVPGGYNNNDPNTGMATLAHKVFFKVFVICNTIAMYTSILASVALIWANLDDLGLLVISLDFALPFLGVALLMMSVAFMAGFYVVLFNVVSWLSIFVLATGGLFIGALVLFYIPLHWPFSCNRNPILRYVNHFLLTIMVFACKQGSKSETH